MVTGNAVFTVSVLDFIRHHGAGTELFPDSVSQTVEPSGLELIDLYFDDIPLHLAQGDLVSDLVSNGIPFIFHWEEGENNAHHESYRLITAGTGAISLSGKPQNWDEQIALVAQLFPDEHSHAQSVLDGIEQLRGMDLIDRLDEHSLLYWIARAYKVGSDVVVPCGSYQWRVEDVLVNSKALSIKLDEVLDGMTNASKAVRFIGIV